jgi:putative resolvase
LNDSRKKLIKLLRDESVTRVVVEHKDRLTRFGFNYLKELAHFEIVIINEIVEDEKDLMQDFVFFVTSFTARLYGKRRTKRATERLIKELKEC